MWKIDVLKSSRYFFFWLLLPAGSWTAVSHTCWFYLLSTRREIFILGSVEGVLKKRSNTCDWRGLRTCGSASLHVCDLFMLLHRRNSIFLKDLCVATRGRCVSIYYWLNKTASQKQVLFFIIFVHCNYLFIGGEFKNMVFHSKNIQKQLIFSWNKNICAWFEKIKNHLSMEPSTVHLNEGEKSCKMRCIV